MKSIKYPKLNDSEWVVGQYRDGASPQKIAKEAGGCSDVLVRRLLLKEGVVLRNAREAKIHGRTEDGFILDRSVVNGCLLGDATLEISSKTSPVAAPAFVKSNKNRDHVEYVARLLFGDQWEQRVCDRTCERADRGGDVYELYGVSSLTHEELSPLFRQWYPQESGYRKVVPPDLEVDETVLLHWFMDDGSSSQRAHRRSKQIVVRFAAQSFSHNEQVMLCEKINTRFDLAAHSTPSPAAGGSGYYIYIPQAKTEDFFSIIGEPPFPSISYKWKQQENRKDESQVPDYRRSRSQRRSPAS